jgi:hypothetical protein
MKSAREGAKNMMRRSLESHPQGRPLLLLYYSLAARLELTRSQTTIVFLHAPSCTQTQGLNRDLKIRLPSSLDASGKVEK